MRLDDFSMESKRIQVSNCDPPPFIVAANPNPIHCVHYTTPVVCLVWIWPGHCGPCSIILVHTSNCPFLLFDLIEALAYYQCSKKLLGAHHGGPILKYIEMNCCWHDDDGSFVLTLLWIIFYVWTQCIVTSFNMGLCHYNLGNLQRCHPPSILAHYCALFIHSLSTTTFTDIPFNLFTRIFYFTSQCFRILYWS